MSTLEDYSHFADMMLQKGVWSGRRILSPKSVAFLTTPQLTGEVRRDMWDGLRGYSYGKLCRVCVEPGQIGGFAMLGEYGWDGWLGSYYANFPGEGMTLLSMQNTTNAGTTPMVRKLRNAVLAALSRGDI